MPVKIPSIATLAAALAALTGTTAVAPGAAEAHGIPADGTTGPVKDASPGLTPNQLLTVGEDLLGFVVTQTPEGTVLAQHVSHASHSSHSSHYSGR